jgi:hypothetical protein
MRYPNGEVPESALVIFKRGWNSRDGDFYWGLPPSTYRKHLALVARALKRTGRTLSPSDGWSTDRPLAAQVAARKRYGNGAARPGTSSLGGFWEGRDTAAIDYGNWAWVYAKFGARAQAEFYADCRAVGLTPGMISKARGYPDEPWHVIDLDPWAPVPTTASTTPASKPAAPASPEEDDMKLLYVTDSVDGNGVPGWALLNTRTGRLVTMRADVPGAQENANSWARVWGTSVTCTRQDMLNAIDAIQQTA